MEGVFSESDESTALTVTVVTSEGLTGFMPTPTRDSWSPILTASMAPRDDVDLMEPLSWESWLERDFFLLRSILVSV